MPSWLIGRARDFGSPIVANSFENDNKYCTSLCRLRRSNLSVESCLAATNLTEGLIFFEYNMPKRGSKIEV